MAKGLIVVIGATGNIGRVLTGTLLGLGARVRAVARDAEKLKALAQGGAETFAASVSDPAAMRAAFAGAESAFLMIPPNVRATDFRAWQNAVAAAEVEGLVAAGVKWLVHLSSVGAHLAKGAGPVNGLHDSEERLNALEGVHVLHLRPSYFMENLLGNIGMIKGMGINGSPLRPDLPIPLIATRDIAAVAAEHLLALDFEGKRVLELLGPRDYTMEEATRILGQAIGKSDLRYVRFHYDEAQKAMMGMGISADVAALFNEMNRGFNEGTVKPTQERTAHTSTPTTLEEFAKTTFAKAYAGN